MHKAWLALLAWLIFHFCFSTCSWCFFSFSCHHPKLALSDFLGIIAMNNLSQLLPLSFLINSGYKWKIHCLCLQNLQALHCLQDKLKILLIGFKDSHNLIYHPINVIFQNYPLPIKKQQYSLLHIIWMGNKF